MEMIESNSPVGPVFTLTLDNGVSHTAMSTAALAPEMSIFAKHINANRERLLPEALVDQARKDIKPVLRTFASEIASGISEKREIDRNRSAALAIPPGLPVELFPEIRNRLNQLDLPQLAERALTGDITELAAQIDGGRNLSHHDDTTWAMVVERALKAFHVVRTGMQADYALKPSAERLIVSGPDNVAAERAASEAFERFKSREAALDDREAVLQSVLTVLAAAQGKTREAVLSEVLA